MDRPPRQSQQDDDGQVRKGDEQQARQSHRAKHGQDRSEARMNNERQQQNSSGQECGETEKPHAAATACARSKRGPY